MQRKHWWEADPVEVFLAFPTVVEATLERNAYHRNWSLIALLLPLADPDLCALNDSSSFPPWCSYLTSNFPPSLMIFSQFSCSCWFIIFSYQLTLQKQSLDKELDTLKEKVKWTEAQLQESQKKEAQTQTKLMVTHTHTPASDGAASSECQLLISWVVGTSFKF